jgi:hypothetical protein
MSRKKRKRTPDPIVPFSDDYIWVRTKEGSYWRRKRGTVKPAKLNDAFTENLKQLKLTAPAAKRMADRLQPFIAHLETGRIKLLFSHFLRKGLKESGRVNFSLLKDYEFQERFPLSGLLLSHQVQETKQQVTVTIPIDYRTIKWQSDLVTDYYFELILLHGDPMKERGLRIESVESPLYPFDPNNEWMKKSTCTISIELPSGKNPWMVMLKLNSHEGNELAYHPRHYRMKVVAAG